jgi:benzoate membrane transport protein
VADSTQLLTASTPDGGQPSASTAHSVAAGAVAAIVSTASSFAVVLSGLRAVGASPAQAGSGLITMGVLMGALTIGIAVRTRVPITIVWSTPGAALLAASGGHADWAAAIGAFMVSGALLMLTGLWRPMGRLIAAIPPALASAMLAGVLMSLCLVPVQLAARSPAQAAPIIVTWLVLSRWARRWAATGALVAAGLVVAIAPRHLAVAPSVLPHLAATMPRPDLGAIIALGIPLFVVTMTSQNIVGMGVLGVYGYRPRLRPLLLSSGGASVAGAPFGAHALNLAAIGAALTAGPEGGPDPGRRWIAAASAGATYVLLGVGSGLVVAFAALAPPLLIESVAGLALLTSLTGALTSAMEDPSARDAAIVTLVVTVAGIAPFGVSSPVWGLAAGLVVHGLAAVRR